MPEHIYSKSETHSRMRHKRSSVESEALLEACSAYATHIYLLYWYKSMRHMYIAACRKSSVESAAFLEACSAMSTADLPLPTTTTLK